MAEEWSWARQMAQGFMESDLAKGMSGVDILDALRAQKIGYRMTLFYDDLRRIRGEEVSSRYVKRLDMDEFVPRRYIGESTTWRWKQPERLRYRMEAVFRDPETGEEEIQHLALMTNKEMTKGAAIREGRPLFSVDVSGIPGELVSIELVGVFHKAGTPY